MRKLAGIVAVAAVVFGATAVMAASPAPSYSAPTASPKPAATAKPSAAPTAKPSASPAPSASPSASPTTAPSAAAANTMTTDVRPIEITGSVTVHRLASGQGTVTFKLNDLLAETANWRIRIDRGFFEAPFSRTLIAARSGDDVQHFFNDTIRIHLSKDEMSDFLAARKSVGVVVFISDGTRLSVAKFPKM